MGYFGRSRELNAYYINIDIRYDMKSYGSEYDGFIARTESQTWQEYRYWSWFYTYRQKIVMGCQCPDYIERRQRCKHIIAVDLYKYEYRGETAPLRDPPHPIGWYDHPVVSH